MWLGGGWTTTCIPWIESEFHNQLCKKKVNINSDVARRLQDTRDNQIVSVVLLWSFLFPRFIYLFLDHFHSSSKQQGFEFPFVGSHFNGKTIDSHGQHPSIPFIPSITFIPSILHIYVCVVLVGWSILILVLICEVEVSSAQNHTEIRKMQLKCRKILY